MDLNQFLTGLAGYQGENTFNPWADHDERYEIENAVAIRRKTWKTTLPSGWEKPESFSSPKPAAIRAAISPALP